MKQTLRKNHAQVGFTLLEIMLVVAIISLLMGVAIYNVVGVRRSAEFVAAESNLKAIAMELATYEMNAGQLPTTEQGLSALTKPPTKPPKPKRWVKMSKTLPKDPWGREYAYLCPGQHNPDSYDLSSLGPDGKSDTEDDVNNWGEGEE